MEMEKSKYRATPNGPERSPVEFFVTVAKVAASHFLSSFSETMVRTKNPSFRTVEAESESETNGEIPRSDGSASESDGSISESDRSTIPNE
ncbi:hypothetical protein TorRG33x02_134960, partial [Trema orientale]